MGANRLVVVGGGVSGIMAAITAKKFNRDLDVVVIEKQDKLLKKLLITGNGRCNFTNIHLDYNLYNNPDFSKSVLSSLDNRALIKLLNDIGLYSETDEEGRVYPYSKQAKSVEKILLNELERLDISLMLATEVIDIKKDKNFEVITNNGSVFANYLVLSVGGKSGGKVYVRKGEFLNTLNIPMTKERPVLVPVKTDKKEVKKLDGIRVKAEVSLEEDNKIIFKEKGEVLFRDYGISGIVIFNMSRFVKENVKQKVHIDLFSEFDFDSLVSFLKFRKENLSKYTFNHFFDGLLNDKLVKVILDRLNILDKSIKDLSLKEIQSIAKILKDFDLNVLGVLDYDMSQVTRGGVDLRYVNKETLESTLINNLYFAGELLDIDGYCGGYNLQFAFSSGYLVGKSIANR